MIENKTVSMIFLKYEIRNAKYLNISHNAFLMCSNRNLLNFSLRLRLSLFKIMSISAKEPFHQKRTKCAARDAHINILLINL